jgi:hypothetical protein
VRARAARVGVYQYTGQEIDPDNAHGLRDRQLVNVLRDENTVFSADAVRSFIGKPVTDNHPSERVTAANWRDHARGNIMGAMRDGEYLAFDLMLTDQSAIEKVRAGQRELSNGYNATLEFGDFKAPDGTPCQARQATITDGNHVALVRFGRAGADCAIKDRWAVCDANPAALADITTKENPAMPGIITVDGLPVSLADEAAVRAVIAKKDAEIVVANAATADANTKLAEEKGKVAALDAQLADAKALVAPAAIDKLVADRSALIGQAKAIVPAVVVDGKSDAEICRAVVTAKLGDKCPTEDAAVSGAFAVLTAGVVANDSAVMPIGMPMIARDTGAVIASMRNMRYA